MQGGLFSRFFARLFLVVCLSLGVTISGLSSSIVLTEANAGLVSKGAKTIALARFGKYLAGKGGEKLKKELIDSIVSDPKILDFLKVQGSRWVKKNPKLQKKISDFVAEAAEASKYERVVKLPRGGYPEAAKHVDDAVDLGLPRALEIFRKGAGPNRKASMRGVKRKSGYDRDEYPPAMFKEGGSGSSVRHISPKDNRGAGACIAAQCRDLPDGTRILLDTVD